MKLDNEPNKTKPRMGIHKEDLQFNEYEDFEHILLNYSKGSETSSGNLLVPLLIYNNMSCIL